MRARNSSLLKLYIVCAMVYGVLGLLDGVLIRSDAYLQNVTIFTYVFGSIALVFFIFSIVAFFRFLHLKLERVTLVLPAYYVVAQLALFGFNFLFSETEKVSAIPTLSIIGVATSLFEIGFALYLVYHLKVFD